MPCNAAAGRPVKTLLQDGKYYAVKFMKKHEIIKLKQANALKAFHSLVTVECALMMPY